MGLTIARRPTDHRLRCDGKDPPKPETRQAGACVDETSCAALRKRVQQLASQSVRPPAACVVTAAFLFRPVRFSGASASARLAQSPRRKSQYSARSLARSWSLSLLLLIGEACAACSAFSLCKVRYRCGWCDQGMRCAVPAANAWTGTCTARRARSAVAVVPWRWTASTASQLQLSLGKRPALSY